jgi:hypothetical protein
MHKIERFGKSPQAIAWGDFSLEEKKFGQMGFYAHG